MARRTFSRSSRFDRFVPFGLFGGDFSGVVLLGLSALLILVSAMRPMLFSPARAGLQNILAIPLQVVSTPFAVLSDTLDYLFSLTQLKTEVAKLRADNKQLEEWYNTAQLLQAENKSLRDLLKVKLEPSLTFITTRVIADTGGPYSQTIVIGSGKDSGFQNGDSVLAGGGLIGRITDVHNQSSVVLLMTDLNSRIPVRIEGSNVQAILAGTNGHDLLIDRAPEGITLTSGQRVLTSGIGGVFPPDLPIGILEKTESGKVIVRPYADLSRLIFVRVVRTPAPQIIVPQEPLKTGREVMP